MCLVFTTLSGPTLKRARPTWRRYCMFDSCYTSVVKYGLQHSFSLKVSQCFVDCSVGLCVIFVKKGVSV